MRTQNSYTIGKMPNISGGHEVDFAYKAIVMKCTKQFYYRIKIKAINGQIENPIRDLSDVMPNGCSQDL